MPLSASRATIAAAASAFALGLGATAVLGWALGVDWLERAFIPGIVLKANAALCLVLLGVGSLLCVRSTQRRVTRAFALSLVCAAGLIATASIIEYATGKDLGIDNLLFREAPGAPETSSAGRMALGAAIGLAVAAGAIASLSLGSQYRRISLGLASFVATLSGLSLLGRLYGSTELTGLGAGTLIAPGTAAALLGLAIAALINPCGDGPLDVLLSATPGGRIARGFALASVVILPVLGVVGQAGVSSGFFGRGFEISVIIAVGVACLVGVGVVLASRFDRLANELQSTAGTLSAILNASPPGIIAIDAESKITFWSDGAERLYGWHEGEVLGRRAPHFADDPRPVVAEQWQRFRDGETLLREETQRLSKSGEIVDVVVTVAALRDSAGEMTGLLTVQEDIRHRKRLEAELLEARKMQTVGQLAGGIAHNFNNLLTAIIGFTSFALAEPLEPKVRRDLEAVNTAANSAAKLVKQMLAFGRRQWLEEEPLNVSDRLLELEPMVRQLVADQVDVRVLVDPQAGSFTGDATQFDQVILNLALNARDAMPEGGRLVIRADQAFVGPLDPPIRNGMAPGNYVVVSVSDTGVGMDASTQGHIFEPFFTTKDVGKGFGLGLSTSYGVVTQMGGLIVVESAPGEGSTFRLYFAALSSTPSRQQLPVFAKPRILLAEADPTVLDLTVRSLEGAGYEVIASTDGVEALAQANQYGVETLSLVVSDAVMPHMRGAELASRLRRQRPDLPIVFVSGYDDQVRAGDPTQHWIAKPFAPADLLDMVRKELDAATGKQER